MKLMSLTFRTIFLVCKSSIRTCSHGQRVQGEEQWGVPHSARCCLLPSSATPLEELPAASEQRSAVAFVTPTGQKAVCLILAHLDLPIKASYSLWLLDLAHYTLPSLCTALPWIITMTGFHADIHTTVSIVFGTFKAPSGFLSGKISTIFGIFIFSLGYISINKSEYFGGY